MVVTSSGELRAFTKQAEKKVAYYHCGELPLATIRKQNRQSISKNRRNLIKQDTLNQFREENSWQF